MSLLHFEWKTKRTCEIGSIPLLKLEHLSVRVGQRLVLDDVSFEVYEGEQVRVIGPNGSGKSTLLNAIAGVLPICEGLILFKGEDISRQPVHLRAAHGIRYMRQRDNVFPSLTVGENLQIALGSNGYEKFRSRFPEWAKEIRREQNAGMLSGGQKQKLAWGMTVLSLGEIFLFDEPSAGMVTEEDILSTLKLTAIYIEHK